MMMIYLNVGLQASDRRRRHQAAAASHLVWSRSQSFACDWVDAASHTF